MQFSILSSCLNPRLSLNLNLLFQQLAKKIGKCFLNLVGMTDILLLDVLKNVDKQIKTSTKLTF